MNLRKIDYKKSLKLVALMISSLLIATVSAEVYNYMFMDATVGVKSTGMKFVEGTDFGTAGGSLSDNDQKVTFSQMNGTIGQLVTYTEPVNITNNDADGHQFELVLDSWTGVASTPLHNVTISMYNSTNDQRGNSIVLVPGEGTGHVTTSGDVTLDGTTGGDNTWRVEWNVFWNGTALTSDYVKVYLQFVIKS